VETAKT